MKVNERSVGNESASSQPGRDDKQGFFWDSPASAGATFAEGFVTYVAEQAERATRYTLPASIGEDEWDSANPSPFCIVDSWFYEDVGVFIAPGGTGKTTLVLFEAIHIVLGLKLFGYEVVNSGPVVILTAEDSREMLVARLRMIAAQMGLTEDQMRTIRKNVIIDDLSGKGFKLTEVVRDVVMPSKNVDRFIAAAKDLSPAIAFIDPAVSFGVGESRVNDAEQGLIEAARRIRNELSCAVVYVHHTGKEAALSKRRDQYAGRGGSAFADGCRMVHVLQNVPPEAWLEATGDDLKNGESGLVLARPKVSHARPQPDLYIKRIGYRFESFEQGGAGATSLLEANGNKVLAILREQIAAGGYPTGRSITPLAREQKIPQKTLRETIDWLVSTMRVHETPLTTGGRGGARSYLRPVDTLPAS
jgi:hypothetical protein